MCDSVLTLAENLLYDWKLFTHSKVEKFLNRISILINFGAGMKCVSVEVLKIVGNTMAESNLSPTWFGEVNMGWSAHMLQRAK